MKYELGQVVYYVLEGQLHSAPILARLSVENAHDDWARTDAQREIFTPFGRTRVVYGTCHGQIEESYCYATAEELAAASTEY